MPPSGRRAQREAGGQPGPCGAAAAAGIRQQQARLATRIRDTFWEPARHITGSGEVTAKNEPPTHVVDAWGRGVFTTVQAAITAARPGDRILVRPGLYESGRGTLEDNEVTANADGGIVVVTDGDPVLRRNRIHDNSATAVKIYAGGRGVFEYNDLTGNERGAWNISPDLLDYVTRLENRE